MNRKVNIKNLILKLRKTEIVKPLDETLSGYHEGSFCRYVYKFQWSELTRVQASPVLP